MTGTTEPNWIEKIFWFGTRSFLYFCTKLGEKKKQQTEKLFLMKPFKKLTGAMLNYQFINLSPLKGKKNAFLCKFHCYSWEKKSTWNNSLIQIMKKWFYKPSFYFYFIIFKWHPVLMCFALFFVNLWCVGYLLKHWFWDEMLFWTIQPP